MAETWRDRWNMIEHRWEAVVKKCWRGKLNPEHPEIPTFTKTDCKAAIEALAIDLWSFRDWLVNDDSSGLTAADVDDFVKDSSGYHLRSCADLATRLKHCRVDDRHRHLLELKFVGTTTPGEPPIMFSAERVFYAEESANQAKQRRTAGTQRVPTANRDEYLDAVELLRRARLAWEQLLKARSLI